jgi:hypothetical protein
MKICKDGGLPVAWGLGIGAWGLGRDKGSVHAVDDPLNNLFAALDFLLFGQRLSVPPSKARDMCSYSENFGCGGVEGDTSCFSKEAVSDPNSSTCSRRSATYNTFTWNGLSANPFTAAQTVLELTHVDEAAVTTVYESNTFKTSAGFTGYYGLVHGGESKHLLTFWDVDDSAAVYPCVWDKDAQVCSNNATSDVTICSMTYLNTSTTINFNNQLVTTNSDPSTSCAGVTLDDSNCLRQEALDGVGTASGTQCTLVHSAVEGDTLQYTFEQLATNGCTTDTAQDSTTTPVCGGIWNLNVENITQQTDVKTIGTVLLENDGTGMTKLNQFMEYPSDGSSTACVLSGPNVAVKKYVPELLTCTTSPCPTITKITANYGNTGKTQGYDNALLGLDDGGQFVMNVTGPDIVTTCYDAASATADTLYPNPTLLDTTTSDS